MGRKDKKTKNRSTQPVLAPEFGTEVASRDVTQWVTMLDYLPNPDPILRAQGGGIQTYRNLVDGHLDAVRDKRTRAVTSRPWVLDLGKGDKAKAKLIEDHLWNLGLRNAIEMMMEAPGFGYQVHEVIWDIVDGLILPTKIKDKPQEWFCFDEDGELVLIDKTATIRELPDRKFIVARHRASASNPYGKALLSRCFWPITFKKGGLKFWMIFTERFGMPKAVGKVPSSATETEQNNFLRKLAGLVRDAVAVIPDNGGVELLETKMSGSQPHPEIIRWADREISKVWLGETLTTEQTDQGGTRALGEVHNEVRKELTMDDADMVETAMNQLIRWIYELNWPTDKAIPWFSIQLPEDLQLGRINRDKNLHDMGLRFNADYFVDTYGINRRHIASISQDNQPIQAGSEFAESTDADAGDALAANASSVNLLDPFRQLVENAESLEQVRDSLIGLYADIPTDKIAGELEQAFLAADLAGRYEILDKAGFIK